MSELRKSNGDYTEEGLRYPGMKADIVLCHKYLHELCEIVWAGSNHKHQMTMWSIPPRPDNFDMQISAGLDELSEYREKEATCSYSCIDDDWNNRKCSGCGCEWVFLESDLIANNTNYCPECGRKIIEVIQYKRSKEEWK